MFPLKNSKILVTGGSGFLGQHLVRRIHEYSPKNLIIPRSKDCDLRFMANCCKVTKNIDIVFHLAGNVGGIGYNQKYPGSLFYDNIMMGTQLMEAARLTGVKKFIAVGTVCCYPKYTPTPFKEGDLWNGYPEETNAPYGLAKKMLLVQSQAYRQQYNFNSAFILPVNLYGPGDEFSPERSHVIPAIIQKISKAKATNSSEIIVWGTGKATREFLYVEDAVEGLILAAKNYNKSDPVNLGSGYELSINHLVKIVADTIGYNGKIIWDTSKPDGQPRRRLDISKAYKEFGFKAKTSFEVGLVKTIQWYQKSKAGNI